METRDKIRGIHEKVSDAFYLSNDTMTVSGEEYQPVSTFGMLTSLVNGNELIKGDPGEGKTTSSEAISSIMFGVPLEVVQDAEIHGHPEQTEEKTKATPNLAKLNEGELEVMWHKPVFLQNVIIDEINRLPPGKHNTLMNEVDRNQWSYHGETVRSPDGPFFSTMNWKDVGNNDIHLPMRDRFDVSVEAIYPGPMSDHIISEGLVDERRSMIDDHPYTDTYADREYVADLQDALEAAADPDAALQEVEQLTQDYLADLDTIQYADEIMDEIEELEDQLLDVLGERSDNAVPAEVDRLLDKKKERTLNEVQQVVEQYAEDVETKTYAGRFRDIMEDDRARADPESVQHKLKALSEEFKQEVSQELDLGFDLPSTEELEAVQQEILNTNLTPDAQMFTQRLRAQMEACTVGKENCGYSTDSGGEQGCHYSSYDGHQVKEFGKRFTQSLRTYAKALAWFDGSEETTQEYIKKVAPFALAHRSSFYGGFREEQRKRDKKYSLQHAMAEEVVEGISNTYEEKKGAQKKAWNSLVENNELDLEELGIQDYDDDPVIKHYQEDLGLMLQHGTEQFVEEYGWEPEPVPLEEEDAVYDDLEHEDFSRDEPAPEPRRAGEGTE